VVVGMREEVKVIFNFVVLDFPGPGQSGCRSERGGEKCYQILLSWASQGQGGVVVGVGEEVKVISNLVVLGVPGPGWSG